MTSPNPFDVVVKGEDPDDVTALYLVVLEMLFSPEEDADALQVYGAWEVTKELWFARRMGQDPQEVLRSAYEGTHFTRRTTEEAEFAHREKVRQRTFAAIRAIISIVRELRGEMGRQFDAGVPLRVVEGG